MKTKKETKKNNRENYLMVHTTKRERKEEAISL